MEMRVKNRKTIPVNYIIKKDVWYMEVSREHLLLLASMLHHYFVYHFERNEVHIKEYFRNFTLMRK